MKIRLSELRRLIREALGGEDLAVYMWNSSYMTRVGSSSSSVKLVLYSPSELLGLDWENTFEIPKDVLKGYAAFGQPENPCHGAWEVSSIAGVGYGKLLYGIGYYLSPSGRLMPDRHFTSPIAKRAWAKSAPNMEGLPFDDVKHPKKGTDQFHDEHHTEDDTSDDCEIVSTKGGGPDPVLNKAYEGPKVNPGPMVAAHKETVDKLTKIFNDLGDDLSREDVEKMLGDMFRKASTKFFTSEFEKYYKEK